MTVMDIPGFRSWIREHGWPNETATVATAIAYAQSGLVSNHDTAGEHGWWGLTSHQIERFIEPWRAGLDISEQVNLGLYYSHGGYDWINFPAAWFGLSTTQKHLYKLQAHSLAAQALPVVKRALKSTPGPQTPAHAPASVGAAWNRVQAFTGSWGRNQYGAIEHIHRHIGRINR